MVTPVCYEEDRIDFATPVGPIIFPLFLFVFRKWLSLSHRLGLGSTLTILSHSDSFTSSFHLFMHTRVLHFLMCSLTRPSRKGSILYILDSILCASSKAEAQGSKDGDDSLSSACRLPYPMSTTTSSFYSNKNSLCRPRCLTREHTTTKPPSVPSSETGPQLFFVEFIQESGGNTLESSPYIVIVFDSAFCVAFACTWVCAFASSFSIFGRNGDFPSSVMEPGCI